jgi:hypothetical protein
MSKGYIEALQDAILHMHGCESAYAETVPLKESFEGKTAWAGDVEVFDLIGHPTASQCYAWGFKDDAEKWQYVAVLQVPPVDSPRRAVQAYIVSQRKKTANAGGQQ